MPQSPHITESQNYKRLESENPKLVSDKEHRRGFHEYLADMERHDENKPTTYEELAAAYKAYKG